MLIAADLLATIIDADGATACKYQIRRGEWEAGDIQDIADALMSARRTT